MIPNLPDDVLHQIFLRLPWRSLYTFRLVCKSWHSLVKDAIFNRLPLQFMLVSGDQGTLHVFDLVAADNGSNADNKCSINLACNVTSIESGKPTFEAETSEWISSKYYKRLSYFSVANSCKGLTCFYLQFDESDFIVVSNPIAGEYIVLQPKFDIGWLRKYALGHSSITNEFKVLRVSCDYNPNKRVPLRSRSDYICTIRGDGKENWRSIKWYCDDCYCDARSCLFMRPPVQSESSGITLHSVIHWRSDEIERYDIVHDDGSMILTFDFNSETFGKILPPTVPEDPSYLEVEIGEWGGYLCLCASSSSDRFEIWVMKEYGVQESWAKEFVIDTRTFLPSIKLLHTPLEFANNGEILLLHGYGELILYNPAKKTLSRSFKLTEEISRTSDKDVVLAYTPSIASLKDIFGVNDNVKMFKPSNHLTLVPQTS